MSTLYPSYLDRYRDKVILFLLLCLAAIWNIPNTIAARYICEALLVILLLTSNIYWIDALKKLKILIIFFVYLLIQLLFFSTDFTAAIKNFKSEWMHFLIFSTIGIGSGIILRKYKNTNILLILGTAFAIPLFIHIFLVAWKLITNGVLPWGYWGVNTHHADLGYASLQSCILLISFIFFQPSSLREKFLSAAIILICVTSPLIAHSRGGVIFTLLAIVIGISLHLFFLRKKNQKNIYEILAVILALIIISITVKIGITTDKNRWQGILTKAEIALNGDPSSVYCNGVESLRDSLVDRGVTLNRDVELALESVVDGDGARIMAARSGLMLIPENLMGINGSKQAYQNAIKAHCGKNPEIFISHTHNAWIDTSLSIGIIGAILLAYLYFNLMILSFKSISNNSTNNAYFVALFLTSFLWGIRGILDSTQRDHILEIQAFSLFFLFALAFLSDKTNTK